MEAQNTSSKTATVWGQKNCKYCEMACKLLAQNKYYVDERKIDNVNWFLKDLHAVVPGARTVPQIFIGDMYIGTYDDLVGYLNANI